MLVTKTSAMTGKTSSMQIDVTVEQINAWKGGTMIQNAMPNLTPDEREFLMTGATPDEWEKAFSDS